jgi:hypothetical protein
VSHPSKHHSLLAEPGGRNPGYQGITDGPNSEVVDQRKDEQVGPTPQAAPTLIADFSGVDCTPGGADTRPRPPITVRMMQRATRPQK